MKEKEKKYRPRTRRELKLRFLRWFENLKNRKMQ